MTLPDALTPLLESVVRTTVRGRAVPLDFWQIDSGPQILDGFMALAPLLMQSDLDEAALPRGYAMLARLFQWEADCQSDGWGAFAHIGSADFERLCTLYDEVGLAAEAHSLRHQMSAYRSDPDDIDSLVRAAQATRHPLSGDLDRLEHLTQYFCDHAAELLYDGPAGSPAC
jgi:hypothetical protein